MSRHKTKEIKRAMAVLGCSWGHFLCVILFSVFRLPQSELCSKCENSARIQLPIEGCQNIPSTTRLHHYVFNIPMNKYKEAKIWLQTEKTDSARIWLQETPSSKFQSNSGRVSSFLISASSTEKSFLLHQLHSLTKYLLKRVKRTVFSDRERIELEYSAPQTGKAPYVDRSTNTLESVVIL